MSIDDLVDKILAKHKTEETGEEKIDIEKPFRYITDEDEIKQELKTDKPEPVSVMTFNTGLKQLDIDQGLFTMALGDLDKIENILKKHEHIRKSRLE